MPVSGLRFLNQPHVRDLSKLQVFVGCAISAPTHFKVETAFFDEFSPFKFKCLEFVDWNLSEENEVVEASAPPKKKAAKGAKAAAKKGARKGTSKKRK